MGVESYAKTSRRKLLLTFCAVTEMATRKSSSRSTENGLVRALEVTQSILYPRAGSLPKPVLRCQFDFFLKPSHGEVFLAFPGNRLLCFSNPNAVEFFLGSSQNCPFCNFRPLLSVAVPEDMKNNLVWIELPGPMAAVSAEPFTDLLSGGVLIMECI